MIARSFSNLVEDNDLQSPDVQQTISKKSTQKHIIIVDSWRVRDNIETGKLWPNIEQNMMHYMRHFHHKLGKTDTLNAMGNGKRNLLIKNFLSSKAIFDK